METSSCEPWTSAGELSLAFHDRQQPSHRATERCGFHVRSIAHDSEKPRSEQNEFFFRLSQWRLCIDVFLLIFTKENWMLDSEPQDINAMEHGSHVELPIRAL